jgi:hypothetical protein
MLPFDISTLDVEDIVCKFRANKVSLLNIQAIGNQYVAKSKLLMTEVNKDIILSKQWHDALSFTANLFRKCGIDYVFVKVLRPDWAIMTDLDVLPLSALDELKALEALKEEGFDLYQSRLLRHPLKIMAVQSDAEISIDFYPKPMWIRKIVCDTEIIYSRRINSIIKGISVPVPSPEDDIYLISTHGFSHLKFTLTEILHGVNVLETCKSFDSEYLTNLALDYGTSDAVFAYLKSIDIYLRSFRLESLYDEVIIKKLRKNWICNNLDTWFKQKCSNSLQFPIELPTAVVCGQSSFYHSKAMFARLSILDLIYDFLTPYLNWASKFFLGKS